MFELSSDQAKDVQRKALDHFKADTFTSYTEMRPEGSQLLLVLGRDSPAGKENTVASTLMDLKSYRATLSHVEVTVVNLYNGALY